MELFLNLQMKFYHMDVAKEAYAVFAKSPNLYQMT